MNDEFADLENELRRLEPRALPPSLEARIGRALDQPAPARYPVNWWQRLGFNRPAAAIGWGIFAPALSAALVLVLTHFSTLARPLVRRSADETAWGRNPATTGAGAEPILDSAHTSNVVYRTLDEGVVLDGSQEPVHRVRYLSADLVQWRNPSTGAHWEIAYPREDVRLVPVRAD